MSIKLKNNNKFFITWNKTENLNKKKNRINEWIPFFYLYYDTLNIKIVYSQYFYIIFMWEIFYLLFTKRMKYLFKIELLLLNNLIEYIYL